MLVVKSWDVKEWWKVMKGACFRKIAPLNDQLQYTRIVRGFLLMIYWRTEALMISP